MHYLFTADHPGVFMYHCATQPVLMHTGAGMVGMFVVKPKNLAPVDKELWMAQQEYYIGKPGGDADMAKRAAHDGAAAPASADVNVTLGDMYVKADKATVK